MTTHKRGRSIADKHHMNEPFLFETVAVLDLNHWGEFWHINTPQHRNLTWHTPYEQRSIGTSLDALSIATALGYRVIGYRLRDETIHPLLGRGGDEASDRFTLTKTAQVRLCGNSVCPPVPEALVRANFHHQDTAARRASSRRKAVGV